MQKVPERLVRMFAMNFVGALDAEVQRWWAFRGVGDADIVIVAYFGGLGIARIGAAIALADEGNEVVCANKERVYLLIVSLIFLMNNLLLLLPSVIINY